MFRRGFSVAFRAFETVNHVFICIYGLKIASINTWLLRSKIHDCCCLLQSGFLLLLGSPSVLNCWLCWPFSWRFSLLASFSKALTSSLAVLLELEVNLKPVLYWSVLEKQLNEPEGLRWSSDSYVGEAEPMPSSSWKLELFLTGTLTSSRLICLMFFEFDFFFRGRTISKFSFSSNCIYLKFDFEAWLKLFPRMKESIWGFWKDLEIFSED